jgi:glycosyltransferase involved in cell wall biosynthesis
MGNPAVDGSVLHVIIPPREGPIGGADLHVLDLAVAQQRDRRWRPVILTPHAPQDYLDRLSQAGLRVAKIPRLSRLPKLISAYGIGLVHAHGYEANYLVATMHIAFRSWARLPTVITAHGWIETAPWHRLKTSADRACARVADVRIATANAHVAGLRFRRGSAAVVHNGVPAPDSQRLARLRAGREDMLRRLSLPHESVLVGTVGRLSPEKRGDLFLSAARRISATRPDVRFVITGGGKQRGELEALASRLGIQDRVIFMGLVSDVTRVYAALDVLVQPSDTEGTPRSVIEAMAHRVPIVATGVGDVPDLLGHGTAGAITPPGDAGALAREVTRLLDQPLRAAEQAERAYLRYRKHFTVEVMHQHTADTYALAVRLAQARNSGDPR